MNKEKGTRNKKTRLCYFSLLIICFLNLKSCTLTVVHCALHLLISPFM